MLFKSQVLTQASGSVGGLTYSHNRAGMYTRARSIPTNPQSQYQQASREALATLSQAWSQTLTPTQRAGWAAYAAAVSKTGILGDPIFITGFNWYVACNAPRLRQLFARIDAPPTDFTLTSLTGPTLAAEEGDAFTTLAFDNGDEWATTSGGYLFISVARALSQTINFFKGPFRALSFVAGDETPPTSPATVPTFDSVPVVPGLKYFVRCIASAADGRLSVPVIVQAIGTGT